MVEQSTRYLASNGKEYDSLEEAEVWGVFHEVVQFCEEHLVGLDSVTMADRMLAGWSVLKELGERKKVVNERFYDYMVRNRNNA